MKKKLSANEKRSRQAWRDDQYASRPAFTPWTRPVSRRERERLAKEQAEANTGIQQEGIASLKKPTGKMSAAMLATMAIALGMPVLGER